MNFKIYIFINLFVLIYANYYDILGVSKSATDLDIKKAYKKLVRKWHPDKNTNKDAEERFMKINEAYEVLSNPEKRKEFDAFGSVSNDQNEFRGNFHEQFGHGFFYNFGHDNTDDLNWVNYKSFRMEILPDSQTKPVLMLIVSQFCFPCHRAMRFWSEIQGKLRDSGVKMVACSISTVSQQLQEYLRVHSVPKVVLILSEQIKYMNTELNEENLIAFLRSGFPSSLITPLKTLSQFKTFQQQWIIDSRPRIVMVKPLEYPPIRYLTETFKYRSRISAGFINLDLINSKYKQLDALRSSYNIPRQLMETILIFHDDFDNGDPNWMPKHVSSSTYLTIAIDTISQHIQQNIDLPVPRITSQSVFDRICPSPTSLSSNKAQSFCIIFVLTTSHSNYSNVAANPFYQEIRSSISTKSYKNIAMIYYNHQTDFINSMQSPISDPQQVILIWRQSNDQLFTTGYTLTSSTIQWILSDALMQQLTSSDVTRIQSLLNIQLTAINSFSVPIDELAPGLLMRIIYRLLQYWQHIWDIIWEILEDPWTVALIISGSIFLYYFCYNFYQTIRQSLEYEHKQQHLNKDNLNSHTKPLSNRYLTAENYASVISDSKHNKSLLSILLCTDATSPSIQHNYIQCLHQLKSSRIEGWMLNIETYPKWLLSIINREVHPPQMDNNQMSLSDCISQCTRHSANPYEGIVLVLHAARLAVYVCPVNLLVTADKPSSLLNDMFPPNDDSSSDDNDDEAINDVTSIPATSSYPINGHNYSATNHSRVSSITGFHDWLWQLLDGSSKKYRLESLPTLHN